jgi:hypothetical protein
MAETNGRAHLFQHENRKDYYPWLAAAAIFAAAAISLWAMGRVWWCEAGDLAPWSWDIWTRHNSQHLIDPYTFTHILHGIFEFWMLGVLFPKMPLAWRLVIAVGIESAWEVGENTDAVIQRYREATLSLDYYGDSISNSLADIVACAGGFMIAYRLRFWRSLGLFLLTELVLVLWIRDSLILNVIMLIYPIEAIKNWQMGG